MTWRIEQHDVSVTPWPLEDESVQCVVTSPPYWGLRDYGTAKWVGGSPECDHDPRRREQDSNSKQATSAGSARDPLQGRHTCRKCGARRIDSQIGLESTPAEYVEMSRRRISAPRSEGEAERRGREDAGQMTWLDGTA